MDHGVRFLPAHGVMPGDPHQYRRRALSCAAAASTSLAASQKFADLALVWLMLAIKLEEQLETEGRTRPPKSAEGLDREYHRAWCRPH